MFLYDQQHTANVLLGRAFKDPCQRPFVAQEPHVRETNELKSQRTKKAADFDLDLVKYTKLRTLVRFRLQTAKSHLFQKANGLNGGEV